MDTGPAHRLSGDADASGVRTSDDGDVLHIAVHRPSRSRSLLSMSPVERLWDRCPASTRLTAEESAELDALPSPVDPVPRSVTCELAADHLGRHVAFTVAASGGERWWWLLWAADLRKLVEAHPCDRRQNHGPHRDDCLLPQDHPGPHSFDIQIAP